MSSDRGTGLRGVAFDLLLASLVTVLIYVEYWDGSPPEFVTTAGPVIAVGGGVVLALVAVYVDTTPKYRKALNEPHIFAVVMGVLLLTIYVLFPSGIPPLATVLIVTFIWTSFVARLLFVHRPF